MHGEDTLYTFYNDGPTVDSDGFKVNETVAIESQNWILSFAATGNPDGKGKDFTFPPYGIKRTIGLLSSLGLGITVSDPAGEERCAFWEKALYF